MGMTQKVMWSTRGLNRHVAKRMLLLGDDLGRAAFKTVKCDSWAVVIAGLRWGNGQSIVASREKWWLRV